MPTGPALAETIGADGLLRDRREQRAGTPRRPADDQRQDRPGCTRATGPFGKRSSQVVRSTRSANHSRSWAEDRFSERLCRELVRHESGRIRFTGCVWDHPHIFSERVDGVLELAVHVWSSSHLPETAPPQTQSCRASCERVLRPRPVGGKTWSCGGARPRAAGRRRDASDSRRRRAERRIDQDAASAGLAALGASSQRRALEEGHGGSRPTPERSAARARGRESPREGGFTWLVSGRWGAGFRALGHCARTRARAAHLPTLGEIEEGVVRAQAMLAPSARQREAPHRRHKVRHRGRTNWAACTRSGSWRQPTM